MTSATAKLSYQRLKQEPLFDQEAYNHNRSILEKVIRRSKKLRRRVHVRRRLIRVKIPSLRRFLRRKTRLVKVAWRKVYKRLKESQSHFGDLFAGNYLFMQVTPTPFNKHSAHKYNLSSSSSSVNAPNHLHAFPSLARI